MTERKAPDLLTKTRYLLRLDKISPVPRKIIVMTVGGLFLVAGLIMIITPGPALVLIPLGILLLATEFAWARRLAQKGQSFLERLRKRRSPTAMRNKKGRLLQPAFKHMRTKFFQ